MGNTIYASFADSSLAEKAAGALIDHGIRPDDLSVVQSEGGAATVTKYEDTTFADRNLDTLAAESAVMTPPSAASTYATTPPAQPFGTSERTYVAEDENDSNVEDAAKHGISTTTGADAEAGAIKGTAWGAGIGAIAAIASLAVPGFGLVLGGGALAAAIGGLVATTGAGAIAGAVTGYLKDQGIEEHVATHYENAITNGGALLAVTVPSGNVSESEARIVLEKYGAGNINAYATRGYLA